MGGFPGERNGNPLQHSCLENPIDREAWRAKSMGSQRVGHDSDFHFTSLHIYICFIYNKYITYAMYINCDIINIFLKDITTFSLKVRAEF